MDLRSREAGVPAVVVDTIAPLTTTPPVVLRRCPPDMHDVDVADVRPTRHELLPRVAILSP